ncbi:hypothetical protein F5148DRAFT_972382 [Russula earlei]|uniref:Uncharacterized protein n=1 Tax=Russula earlei TaxID=71964 RepID=A0ACC0UN78_9AGAM|nr:hypothetical protein F5148DRAFT_972382 [Russula earlei]
MPGWQSLPLELIVRILEALDPQTLVHCRRVIRLNKFLIDDTVSLQYRIALYSAGLIDGPSSTLTTSERLSLLKSYEASWKDMDWSAQISLPVAEGGLWEFYGNVWAHSTGIDTIEFVQLPSRLRGISLRQWTVRLDFAPRDFGIDPSQDLLVTIERITNASHLYRMRFLKLSTGEKYSLSSDTATNIEYTPATPVNPFLRLVFSIRVSGDYVGILFKDNDFVTDGDYNELVVWNWKTGSRNLSVTLLGIESFTFFGDGYVMASSSPPRPLGNAQPALLLYSIDQRVAQNTESPHAPLLRYLPPYSGVRGQSLFICLMTSDPSPIWSSSPGLQVPFQIPHNERAIAFTLRRRLDLIQGNSYGPTFLVPASTLLKHVNNITVGEEGRDIEWEQWGASGSLVPYQGQWSVNTCFVFGMRHILPLVVVRDDRQAMIVRDLCPRRCMRASEEEREESNALHHTMGCVEPYPRTIVKCVPLPACISNGSDVELMISEDGVVILEVRHRHVCVIMAARLTPWGCRPT